MKTRALLLSVILLSLAGIADAWYLAQHALTDTPLFCGIGEGALSGCNIVAQSPYSHLFGVPLGVYGLGFYILMFVLGALALVLPGRRLTHALFGFSILGMLFSIYFIGLQVFVIDALCIYCVGSFVISTGLFLASLSLWKRTPPRVAVVL